MKYALMIAAVALAAVTGWSQHSSRVSGRHPAIRYETSEVHDPVAALNQKLANGAARLNFDNTFGYLQPVLEALQVPVESQILVFSKTSLIYSDAFRALPMPAKSAIYRRMWEILSGKEGGAKYARLSVADREAVIEILRDTLEDLPDYFKTGICEEVMTCLKP